MSTANYLPVFGLVFLSGTNAAGEIRGTYLAGRQVGVSVCELNDRAEAELARQSRFRKQSQEQARAPAGRKWAPVAVLCPAQRASPVLIGPGVGPHLVPASAPGPTKLGTGRAP